MRNRNHSPLSVVISLSYGLLPMWVLGFLNARDVDSFITGFVFGLIFMPIWMMFNLVVVAPLFDKK
jgi:hypothetical protein